MHHFRIWGCPAHVLRPKSGKLESWSEVCIFIGYASETRGGYFYSPKDQNVFVSTNATFLEHDYMNNYKPHSKVVLEELTADKIPSLSSSSLNDKRKIEESIIPRKETSMQHYSGRNVRQPVRYEHEAHILVSNTDKDDPLTFKEEMEDLEREKSQEAMNQEMESIYSNYV